MRTVHTALGPRRTVKEEEAGGNAPSHATPEQPPEGFTEEDVRLLGETLADPKLAAAILPRGATVGCGTEVEYGVTVGGHTAPQFTPRATSVQLRDGSTFSVRGLLASKLIVARRWRGCR